MKRLLAAMALASVLSISTLAGEISTSGVIAPPPGETTPTASVPAPGEVPSVGLTQQMSGAAFDLLELVLGGIV